MKLVTHEGEAGPAGDVGTRGAARGGGLRLRQHRRGLLGGRPEGAPCCVGTVPTGGPANACGRLGVRAPQQTPRTAAQPVEFTGAPGALGKPLSLSIPLLKSRLILWLNVKAPKASEPKRNRDKHTRY